MLSGHQLSKSYAGHAAIKAANYSVKPGAISALVGASGSGKSTLHRVLGFVEAPDCGTIALDGVQLWPRAEDSHVARPGPWPLVTLVFQQLFLWPHLTLRQNIQLPLRRLSRSRQQELVEESVSLFHMEAFVDRFPNELSGGEKQRGALGRAFAVGARYILLDEPTTALDLEQRYLLAEHLIEMRRRGIGLSIITHWLGFVRHVADTVTVLDHGESVESVPTAQLQDARSPAMQRLLEHASYAD